MRNGGARPRPAPVRSAREARRAARPPRLGSGAQLRVLLLGGFEVWHNGAPVRGFESQKVRALLAYLLLNRGRAFSRDTLAALFWPDRDEEAARRNLRQALYNLRDSLPADEPDRPLLELDGQSVLCSPDADVWLDVEALAAALRPQPGGQRGLAAHQIGAATNLYRGDLLAGFFLRDCPEFDEWLAAEQERLREVAVGALRMLSRALRARGEHRLAIQYTRRLVAMDPLSEESHRDLMELYALTGQRNRALSHYHDVRAMLARELGVEPLDETTALFQKLLGESVLQAAEAERGAPIRPVMPLAGRDEAIERLGAAWVAALEGEPRVTVVEGEEGVGKTRLVRTFLDMATIHRPAVVATGRCLDRFPQVPYAPFVQMLRQLVTGDGDAPPLRLGRATSRALARLLPELAGAGAAPDAAGPDRLFPAVAAAFAAVARRGGAEAVPLVLFLDDLQWADPGTQDLFAYLAGRPVAAPIWLIAATTATGVPPPRGDAGGHDDRVVLGRLGDADLEDIARTLVPEAQVPDLAAVLQGSAGLPLAVVVIVNTLWDDGALATATGGDGWHLGTGGAELHRIAGGSLDDLVRGRVRRLPTSVRRLASLAAIVGDTFDVDLLCRAEDEHPAVVEIGIEILLERWLVRASGRRWNQGGLESGIAPWARGLHGGAFEFDHERIRRLVAADVNPVRAQVLHAQTARALAALRAPDAYGLAEELAHHALLANDWEAALRHLEDAAERALRLSAVAGAIACLESARAAADRLRAAAASGDERGRWRGERERIEARLAALVRPGQATS